LVTIFVIVVVGLAIESSTQASHHIEGLSIDEISQHLKQGSADQNPHH